MPPSWGLREATRSAGGDSPSSRRIVSTDAEPERGFTPRPTCRGLTFEGQDRHRQEGVRRIGSTAPRLPRSASAAESATIRCLPFVPPNRNAYKLAQLGLAG